MVKAQINFIHNNSNMRNKQMEINTCKFLPFLKNSRTYIWKMTSFPWFRKFASPVEKISPCPRKWVRAWFTFWSGVGEGGGVGVQHSQMYTHTQISGTYSTHRGPDKYMYNARVSYHWISFEHPVGPTSFNWTCTMRLCRNKSLMKFQHMI